MSFVTFIKLGYVWGYPRFAGQIVLCICLCGLVITKKESEYIRQIYVFATAIYAILIIIECYRNISTRFYHGDIMLLGAEFDPNYIGIPLVTSAALALEKILKSKRRILYIVVYLFFIIAIMFTGSKGNAIGLAISHFLVIFQFLKDKEIKIVKRIATLVLIILAILLLINLFSELFPKQWARMSSISSSDDNGRYELWRISFEAWKSHPVFGNGFRSMSINNGMVTHNTFLQLLSETGIVGAILFLAFLVPTIVKAYKCDHTLGSIAIAMLFQIAFLDSLDNRAVWVVLIWLAMLPKNFEDYNFEKRKQLIL